VPDIHRYNTTCQEDIDTLLRVQDSKSGHRKLVSNAMKKEPWLTMSKDTWRYGLGACTVVPKIQDALRACASDPDAWVKAASLIPSWKNEVRPGTTSELEDTLWKVLLAAWENFDPDDKPGSTALLERLRLGRCLIATSRPDADCIDRMELTAPRPQI
jgi:hypothetical protein